MAFRGAYGVLRLTPQQFGRMLPGEFADMMSARAWVNEQQSKPSGPMSDLQRAAEIGKLDEKLARARGEHR